jgi:hypothetical protein
MLPDVLLLLLAAPQTRCIVCSCSPNSCMLWFYKANPVTLVSSSSSRMISSRYTPIQFVADINSISCGMQVATAAAATAAATTYRALPLGFSAACIDLWHSWGSCWHPARLRRVASRGIMVTRQQSAAQQQWHHPCYQPTNRSTGGGSTAPPPAVTRQRWGLLMLAVVEGWLRSL